MAVEFAICSCVATVAVVVYIAPLPFRPFAVNKVAQWSLTTRQRKTDVSPIMGTDGKVLQPPLLKS